MGIDRRHYAEGIVKVGRFCFGAPSPMAAGVGSPGLRGRIQHILTHVPPPTRGDGRLVAPALVAVAAAVAMAAGAGSAAVAAQGGQDERVPAVTRPSVVTRVLPSYTRQAMQARIEGTVVLEAVVGETGAVGEIRIVRSLDTEHGLDDQAVAALRQWQFEPGRRDGEPVAVSVTVEMDFTLRSSTR
jgi:TonB family protein